MTGPSNMRCNGDIHTDHSARFVRPCCTSSIPPNLLSFQQKERRKKKRSSGAALSSATFSFLVFPGRLLFCEQRARCRMTFPIFSSYPFLCSRVQLCICGAA